MKKKQKTLAGMRVSGIFSSVMVASIRDLAWQCYCHGHCHRYFQYGHCHCYHCHCYCRCCNQVTYSKSTIINIERCCNIVVAIIVLAVTLLLLLLSLNKRYIQQWKNTNDGQHNDSRSKQARRHAIKTSGKQAKETSKRASKPMATTLPGSDDGISRPLAQAVYSADSRLGTAI